MSYDWLVALSLVKILAAFAFFFIYLPTKIFPQRRDAAPVDRFFDNLVLMTSTGIVFVHLLALLHIYSIVTVLLCYLLLYTVRIWHREKTFPLEVLRSFVVQKTVLTLDILDSVVDLKVATREFVQKKWAEWKERAGDRQAVVHVLLFGTILIYAAALRYANVFRSPVFVFSDPYSHLLWMKQLESGNLYPSGTDGQYYPRGFHSFLAILHGLTGLDGSLSVLLTGPLVGTLLVVAVYYLGKRLTQSTEAALIGMFLFGTFIEPITLLHSYYLDEGVLETKNAIDALYPRWFMRQTTPLPDEFGLLFLLPVLFSAYVYLTERRRRVFVLFCLGSITIFMTHPLISATLAVGLGALVITSFLLRILAWNSLKALTIAGFVTAVVGNLQLIYAFLFDQGVVERVAQGYSGASWLGGFGALPYTFEIMTSAALGSLFLLGGVFFAGGRERKLLWGFFGLYVLLLVFLGRSVNFGVRYLIGPDRLGHYRILLLCGALAGVYSLVTFFPLLAEWYRARRWLYQTVTALSLMVLGVFGFPSEIPSPPHYEYDSLAEVSYRIKRAFPPLEWTLVSTTEDYSKVYKDKGWHMNVGEFLETYDPYDPEFEIPTPYTFIFVEKRFFAVSSDPSLNRPGVRLDLERRLQEWTSIYRMLHEDMSVFYEDWDILVYLVTQNHVPKPAEPLQAVSGATEFPLAFLHGIKKLWRAWGS